MIVFLLAACQSAETVPDTPIPTVTPTPEIGVAFATRVPPTIAVVQVTPTPLPTPSPTPTPTPIIYVVNDGDTLWDVAYLNRTTVEEIVAANPDVRPETLQIGQAIVLPPPATPVFGSARATRQPIAIDVVSLRTYRTPVDTVWVLGEVRNRGDLAAENVQIEVTLLDQTGTAATTVQAWVAPGITPPGARAPFSALVQVLPAALSADGAGRPVDSVASIVGGETVAALGSRYLDLAARDLVVDSAENRTTVSGTVHNIGEESAETLTIVITLYDAQGNISGTIQLFQTEPLLPGTQRPFTASVAPPGGAVVDAGVLVQGVRVENDGTVLP